MARGGRGGGRIGGGGLSGEGGIIWEGGIIKGGGGMEMKEGIFSRMQVLIMNEYTSDSC